MNGIRKLLVFVAALALATFALSASAGGSGNPNKAITLTNVSGQNPVLGATLQPGTYDIFLQLNNTGQSGNASSAELDYTNTPLLTINSASLLGSKGPVAGVSMSGQTPGGFLGFTFTYTLPNKSSVVITLNVTVSAGSTCGGPQVTWQPYAWTGGVSTPSTSFTYPPTGTYTSSLPGAPNCTLAFTQQPADAFVNSVITTVPFSSTATTLVTVHADQGGTAAAGVLVSVSVTPGSGTCSISGSATTNASGDAKFTSIASSTAGTDCELTATATGFTNSLPSSPFDVVAFLSLLDCSPANGSSFGDLGSILASQYSVPPVYTVPGVGPATWGLLRGKNRDGSCPSKVPFTFSVDGTTNTAIFTEDSLGQQTSVEYIVRWKSTDLVEGWADFQPCMSYGITDHPLNYQIDNNGVCFGDFVPTPACVADDVNGPGDGTQVMPLFPDAYPYNLTGSLYPPNNPSKVCVTQQGWNVDSGKVQFWHKFIDQTDTTLRGP